MLMPNDDETRFSERLLYRFITIGPVGLFAASPEKLMHGQIHACVAHDLARRIEDLEHGAKS
jgi:hypothetical protein